MAFLWTNSTQGRDQVPAQPRARTACVISAICPITAFSTGASAWISHGSRWTLRLRSTSPFRIGGGLTLRRRRLTSVRCRVGSRCPSGGCRQAAVAIKPKSSRILCGIVIQTVSSHSSQTYTRRPLELDAIQHGCGSSRSSKCCVGRSDHAGPILPRSLLPLVEVANVTLHYDRPSSRNPSRVTIVASRWLVRSRPAS